MDEREKEIRKKQLSRWSRFTGDYISNIDFLLSIIDQLRKELDNERHAHVENMKVMAERIDSLRAENKELREAVGPIISQFEAWEEIPNDDKYIGIMIGDLRNLKHAYEKGKR